MLFCFRPRVINHVIFEKYLLNVDELKVCDRSVKIVKDFCTWDLNVTAMYNVQLS